MPRNMPLISRRWKRGFLNMMSACPVCRDPGRIQVVIIIRVDAGKLDEKPQEKVPEPVYMLGIQVICVYANVHGLDKASLTMFNSAGERTVSPLSLR